MDVWRMCSDLLIVIMSGLLSGLLIWLTMKYRGRRSIQKFQAQVQGYSRHTAALSDMIKNAPDDTSLFPRVGKDKDAEER